MRKILTICLLALVAISAISYAEDVPSRPLLGAEGRSIVAPSNRAACVLTTVDPAATINSFGWADFDAYAAYVDVTTDGDVACVPAVYPFAISSVDVPLLFFFGAEGVGTTVNYRLGIHCPKDAASPGVPENLKGPGAEICGVDVSYTVTQADFDANPDMFIQNVPLTCCVNGPFYVIASFVSYDGGYGLAPTPGFDLTVGCPYTEVGDAWFHFDLGVGYCWLAGNRDMSCGSTCCPGDVLYYVNGESDATCEPIVCVPCDRTLPGETDANPIEVDWTSSTYIVDLCDYCSDYDMWTAIGGASYSASCGDVVLSWTPTAPLYDPFCFYISISPYNCNEFFRVRSWLTTSTLGLIDYSGSGIDGHGFPGVGGTEVYNYSTGSNNGCFFADTYYLYVDGRQYCCCPVKIRMFNDEVLPVEITSFDAIAGNGEVRVTWATRAESDIEHYEIMRNGTVVAEIAGQGDSETGHTYSFVDNGVQNGTTYTYQLVSYDFEGAALIHPAQAQATPNVGAGIVSEYALLQNYPNPFNPTTNISYTLKEAGLVTLKVYSVDGREVATLVDGNMASGLHTVEFDASGLSSGMYVYRMDVNGVSATQKMVLMK